MRTAKMVATITDDGENTSVSIESDNVGGRDAMFIAKSLISAVAGSQGISIPEVLAEFTVMVIRDDCEEEVSTTE